MDTLLKDFLLFLAKQGEIMDEQPQAIVDRFKKEYKPQSDVGDCDNIFAMRILNPALPDLGILFVRGKMMVDWMQGFAEEMMYPDVDLEWDIQQVDVLEHKDIADKIWDGWENAYQPNDEEKRNGLGWGKFLGVN